MSYNTLFVCNEVKLLRFFTYVKISVFTCNEVIFYELRFSCNKVRLLINIYFLLRYFCYTSVYIFSKRSQR